MSEYTPQENKFLERLGFTPGPWQWKYDLHGERLALQSSKRWAVIVVLSEYNRMNKADKTVIEKSPDIFLALFHVAHTEQHFCQEAEEVARFESIIAPLESATNKTWPDLCRIWEECKC